MRPSEHERDEDHLGYGDDTHKASHAEAHYTQHSTPDRRCGVCSMYQGRDNCSAVQAPISPHAVCKFFEADDGDDMHDDDDDDDYNPTAHHENDVLRKIYQGLKDNDLAIAHKVLALSNVLRGMVNRASREHDMGIDYWYHHACRLVDEIIDHHDDQEGDDNGE